MANPARSRHLDRLPQRQGRENAVFRVLTMGPARYQAPQPEPPACIRKNTQPKAAEAIEAAREQPPPAIQAVHRRLYSANRD